MLYKGTEHFSKNGKELHLTMNDFLNWACSENSAIAVKSTLSKFIVASSLGLSNVSASSGCKYDLLTKKGYKVKVSFASYLQSLDDKHPDYICYSTAGDADFHVFCLYKATSISTNPLNLDLWDFFVVHRDLLKRVTNGRHSITLPRLLDIGAWQCDYCELADAI